MTLPQDPNILVSMVNMKLRDCDYESLGDLCLSLGVDEEELTAKLKGTGFIYYPELRQFR